MMTSMPMVAGTSISPSASLAMISEPLVQSLAWALVRSVWQGVLIGLALLCVLQILADSGPRIRYRAACLGLIVMVALPLFTLIRSGGAPAGSPTPAWAVGVVAAWVCGVSVFSLRLAGGCWWAYRVVARSGRPATEPWRRRFEALAHRLAVRRPVWLLESTRVVAPRVTGWLRPVVLIPVHASTEMKAERLEAVLATSWRTFGGTITP